VKRNRMGPREALLLAIRENGSDTTNEPKSTILSMRQVTHCNHFLKNLITNTETTATATTTEMTTAATTIRHATNAILMWLV